MHTSMRCFHCQCIAFIIEYFYLYNYNINLCFVLFLHNISKIKHNNNYYYHYYNTDRL